MKLLHVLEGFVISVLLAVFSYFVLDARISIFFYHLAVSYVVLRKYESHIPDLLFPAVIVTTVLCWTVWYMWLAKGIKNVHTRFLQLCGVSVPLAYTAKTVLQYAFGRADPRLWLAHRQRVGLHWLPGGAGFPRFPSGHRAGFMAAAAELWLRYPRFRAVYASCAVLLGSALVATNYHFVSDVVAGAYLGVLVSYICDVGLVATSESYRATGPMAVVGD